MGVNSNSAPVLTPARVLPTRVKEYVSASESMALARTRRGPNEDPEYSTLFPVPTTWARFMPCGGALHVTVIAGNAANTVWHLSVTENSKLYTPAVLNEAVVTFEVGAEKDTAPGAP
jgi:hypothetical protein